MESRRPSSPAFGLAYQQEFPRWLVVFVVSGILAFLGNRTLFYVYAALMIPFTMGHTVLVCARCSNVHCAINAKSPDFVFRFRRHTSHIERPSDPGYSDINTKPAAAGLARSTLHDQVGPYRADNQGADERAEYRAGEDHHRLVDDRFVSDTGRFDQ